MEDDNIKPDKLAEVYDDHNMPNQAKSVYDVPAPEDIKVTGAMKMFFILCSVVGIFYSLYMRAIFQSVVWVTALIFIMDMMGSFDKIGAFLREGRKPRGGYESIER